MTHKHKLKLIRDSVVYYQGKTIPVYVYQCQECKKLLHINIDTDTIVDLDDAMGPEIRDE